MSKNLSNDEATFKYNYFVFLLKFICVERLKNPSTPHEQTGMMVIHMIDKNVNKNVFLNAMYFKSKLMKPDVYTFVKSISLQYKEKYFNLTMQMLHILKSNK